jgi:hypothetical protein
MWVTNGANNYPGYSAAFSDRLIQHAGNVALFTYDPEDTLATVRDRPALPRLLAEARAATGAEKRGARERIRMGLFQEAEAILVQDEFPIIPVYFYINGGLIRPHVRGFSASRVLPDDKKEVNSQDLHPLRDMWIAAPGDGT